MPDRKCNVKNSGQLSMSLYYLKIETKPVAQAGAKEDAPFLSHKASRCNGLVAPNYLRLDLLVVALEELCFDPGRQFRQNIPQTATGCILQPVRSNTLPYDLA